MSCTITLKKKHLIVWIKGDTKMTDKEMIEEMANDIYGLKSCDTYFEENCKLLAYDLFTLDWVKLPKDSVVLSREEYELLTDIKDLQQQVQDSLSNMSEDIERVEKQARKETAEKILNEVYWLVARKDVINVLTRIKEIATKNGVEIKE